MEEKKSMLHAVENGTIEQIVAMFTQYDEDSILPLLMTVEDIVYAYFREKYGDLVTVDEMRCIREQVSRDIGRYNMSREEVNFYDNYKVNVKKINKDELPFD